MPQVEQKIIREQIIVVDHSETDQYGNLIVTDKAGNKHKIGVKRDNLFGVIVPGRAVKFGYATYMNKEYIADAILVETPPAQPPPTSYPKPPQENVQSKSSPVEPKKGGIIPIDSRNRPFCMSYSKDVLVAKIAAGLVKDITKIEVEKMLNLADTMLRWIDNEPNLVTVAKEHGAKEVEDKQ